MKMGRSSGLFMSIMQNPQNLLPPDLPEPAPSPEPPRPPLGYLPAGLAWSRSPPPASAAPAGDSSSSSAAASTSPQPAAPAESEMRPPTTAQANLQPEPAPRPRRSPKLNPEPDRACAIKSHRLGHCEAPPISHGHAIRGIYGPLLFAMAQNDADGLCAHPSLVSGAGGVRFLCQTSAWEVTDPHRWP